MPLVRRSLCLPPHGERLIDTARLGRGGVRRPEGPTLSLGHIGKQFAQSSCIPLRRLVPHGRKCRATAGAPLRVLDLAIDGRRASRRAQIGPDQVHATTPARTAIVRLAAMKPARRWRSGHGANTAITAATNARPRPPNAATETMRHGAQSDEVHDHALVQPVATQNDIPKSHITWAHVTPTTRGTTAARGRDSTPRRLPGVLVPGRRQRSLPPLQHQLSPGEFETTGSCVDNGSQRPQHPARLLSASCPDGRRTR